MNGTGSQALAGLNSADIDLAIAQEKMALHSNGMTYGHRQITVLLTNVIHTPLALYKYW